MPYLLDTKIKVKFDGIKINTERQLFEGKLVTTYDKTEQNVFEVPIIKSIESAIKAIEKIFKNQKEIAQKQESLEKQLADNKIDKEKYTQESEKIKEEIAQNDKSLDAVSQYIKESPSLTEADKENTINQVNSFKSSGSKQSFDESKADKLLTAFRDFKKKEAQTIAEIKKTLQDFIYNENICGDWKKVDGKNDKFDGKFGSYNLDYTEYQECTNGTFYKVSEEFRFYHTAFNLYDAYDQPGRFFYIYNPDTQKWVRFFPDFREFNRDPMPAEMRELLLTTMDYVIPVESGYILITGKNFEGEERNRLIAGTSLLVEAGLSFTVVGKGFYKAGKGALKAGANATKSIIKKATDYFKDILKIKRAGKTVQLLDKKLIEELKEKGIKFTEEDLMWVFKNRDGKIIFLEKGSQKGGFEHILKHKKEFLDKGIKESDIPDLIMESLKNGKIVGYQGKGRPIYKVIYKGKEQSVAITVGNNGFVVGANINTSIK